MSTEHQLPSREERERLLQGWTAIQDRFAAGEDINTATAKTAADMDLTPAMTQLMIFAFNNNSANNHRRGAEGFHEKLATFPLIDSTKVFEIVEQLGQKSARVAVAADYSDFSKSARELLPRRSNGVVKEAAVAEPVKRAHQRPIYADGTRRRAAGMLDRFERMRTDLRHMHWQKWDEFQQKQAAFHALFGDRDSPTIAQAKEGLEYVLGADTTRVLLANVAANPKISARVKTAESHELVDMSRIPLTRLAYEVVTATTELVKVALARREFERQYFPLELQLQSSLHRDPNATPLPPDPNRTLAMRLSGQKRAYVVKEPEKPKTTFAQKLASMSGDVVANAQTLAGSSFKDLPELKEDALNEITAPGHENDLRKIRVQLALAHIMNGAHFSGEDPRYVADLFNQVVATAPRLADKPLVAETVMRRLAAQGGADVHDLDQLTKLDFTIGRDLENKMRIGGGTES